MRDNNATRAQQQTVANRAAREAFWRDLWQKRSWRAWLLTPFSLLFLWITQLRRVLYRTGFLESKSIPVPVIVIGGIMIGGVGKTPVVAYLARALKQAGFNPVIISRGYTADKANENLLPRAVTEISSPDNVGDEPILHFMKTGLPVWVGRKRAETAMVVTRVLPECNVIICDDGLQHYALARDIEVSVMDERNVGNGWVLPAGPLREPPSRLDQVDAVVWHHRLTDGRKFAPKSKIAQNDGHNFDFHSYISDAYDLMQTDYRLPLSYFAGKSVLAMAGIAQPEMFFNMLAAHNIHGTTLALPDHFKFDEAFIQRDNIQRAEYILMTEKDAVKYRHLIAKQEYPKQRFWVVPLEVIDNQASQSLSQFIIKRLGEIAHEFN